LVDVQVIAGYDNGLYPVQPATISVPEYTAQVIIGITECWIAWWLNLVCTFTNAPDTAVNRSIEQAFYFA